MGFVDVDARRHLVDHTDLSRRVLVIKVSMAALMWSGRSHHASTTNARVGSMVSFLV